MCQGRKAAGRTVREMGASGGRKMALEGTCSSRLGNAVHSLHFSRELDLKKKKQADYVTTSCGNTKKEPFHLVLAAGEKKLCRVRGKPNVTVSFKFLTRNKEKISKLLLLYILCKPF